MRRRGRGGAGCSPAGTDPISTAVAALFSAWEKAWRRCWRIRRRCGSPGGWRRAHTGKVLDGTGPVCRRHHFLVGEHPGTIPGCRPSRRRSARCRPFAGRLQRFRRCPNLSAPRRGRRRSTPAGLPRWRRTPPGCGRPAPTSPRWPSSSAARLAPHPTGMTGFSVPGPTSPASRTGSTTPADYAREAAAADHSADHVRDAVSGTPRPETFTHLQARINEGPTLRPQRRAGCSAVAGGDHRYG